MIKNKGGRPKAKGESRKPRIRLDYWGTLDTLAETRGGTPPLLISEFLSKETIKRHFIDWVKINYPIKK